MKKPPDSLLWPVCPLLDRRDTAGQSSWPPCQRPRLRHRPRWCQQCRATKGPPRRQAGYGLPTPSRPSSACAAGSHPPSNGRARGRACGEPATWECPATTPDCAQRRFRPTASRSSLDHGCRPPPPNRTGKRPLALGPSQGRARCDAGAPGMRIPAPHRHTWHECAGLR